MLGLTLSSVSCVLSSVNQKKSFLGGLLVYFLHTLGDGTIGGHFSGGVTVKPQTAEWSWLSHVD